MYEKQIATVTRAHFDTHLATYLAEVENRLSINLIPPKSFKITSVVGGIIQQTNLPAYALDCLTKELSDSVEDLPTYRYGGQITGMVGAYSEEEVDDQAKAHKAVAELFVHRHLYLGNSDTTDFKMLAFARTGSELSGAMQTDIDPENPYWISAWALTVEWLVSESQPEQHA